MCQSRHPNWTIPRPGANILFIFLLRPRPIGPGPIWARAHLGPGPFGPGPVWAQARLDPGPFGPRPVWARARLARAHFPFGTNSQNYMHGLCLSLSICLCQLPMRAHKGLAWPGAILGPRALGSGRGGPWAHGPMACQKQGPRPDWAPHDSKWDFEGIPRQGIARRN